MNMKKIFKWLLISAAVAVSISCEGNKIGGDEQEEEPEVSEFYEFPLSIEEDGFQAGTNGVSVAVSSVKENNIVFNLIPGSAIKSYRGHPFESPFQWRNRRQPPVRPTD